MAAGKRKPSRHTEIERKFAVVDEVLDRLEAQLGTAVQADEPLIISGDGPDAVETTGAQNHQPSRNGSQLAAGETAAVELPRAEVADG